MLRAEHRGGDQESAKSHKSAGFPSLLSRRLGVLKYHCRSETRSASDPLRSLRPAVVFSMHNKSINSWWEQR